MIEPLEENDMLYPLDVGKKLNEMIDAFNRHFHHAREIQFGTDLPQLVERVHEDDGA